MKTVMRGLSLGRKGMWTLAALCAYFLMVTAIVTFERLTLMNSVSEMNLVHSQEERQVSVNLSVAHAVQTVNENYFAPDIASVAQILVVEIESILPSLINLATSYPVLLDDIAALQSHDMRLLQDPSRAEVAELRATLHRLVTDIDMVTDSIRTRKQQLLVNYRTTYNRVTLEWLLLVLLGVSIFGGIGWSFFRRLSRDINTVHDRAIDIVRGYRGDALLITRGDEIGALMEAVNVMQTELRQRETQLELGRQQQFHKEKMAAVGSLAAAVAHEINNPLSAIVGIAEAISEQQELRGCKHSGSACHPALILDQARRVIAITRHISEFSVPQSPEPELIDLNGIVRSTCSFVSFDRRFRKIHIIQQLDSQLPAIYAVADHLVQVLMNLLINAADAIEETGCPEGQITVNTGTDARWIRLSVKDNGTGISPEIQEKVFNEYFSTKPPGRGSGLGLALCRSLIESAGGRIVLVSQPGYGTEILVTLPVPDGI